MAAFGSDDWLAEVSDPMAEALGASDGGPVRVQHVVSGGPDGDVRYGSVVDSEGSVDTATGDVEEPDVTFTSARTDALAVISGEMTPNVAYMRGRLKAAGNTGQLLALLAAAEGEGYERARGDLAARTEQ